MFHSFHVIFTPSASYRIIWNLCLNETDAERDVMICITSDIWMNDKIEN